MRSENWMQRNASKMRGKPSPKSYKQTLPPPKSRTLSLANSMISEPRGRSLYWRSRKYKVISRKA